MNKKFSNKITGDLQKNLYEHTTTTHMMCILLLILIITINYNLTLNYSYDAIYTSYIYILILSPCLLILTVIYTYTKLRATSKDSKYLNMTDFLYVTTSLFLSFISVYAAGKSVFYADSILLMPIIIAASIRGKRFSLITATICSFFLLSYQLLVGKQLSFIKTLEADLVILSMFYIIAWFIGGLTDIEKENREQLNLLANTDMLTGLYNHRYFQDSLKNFFENNEGEIKPLSLIIIDIDYFKHYNDSFGHLEGDNVLHVIGKFLNEAMTEPAFAARYGGEEFVLFLPGYQSSEAVKIAEKVRAQIESHPFSGQEYQPGGKITVSCGIATYPMHAASGKELVRHADLALYRAKSLNKNKVELYFSVFEDLVLKDDEKELFNSIRTLISVINAKDRYTYGHSERVTDYSLRLAAKINLPSGQVKLLKYAAFLHDIGKIEIDRDVLNKTSRLNEEEWQILKQHPQWGGDIIKSIAGLLYAAPVIYHHHENYDGSGYPDGIKEQDIPLLSRIIRLADSYDAMTSNRPYKKVMSRGEVINELKRCSGTMFDPYLTQIFIAIIEGSENLSAGIKGDSTKSSSV